MFGNDHGTPGPFIDISAERPPFGRSERAPSGLSQLDTAAAWLGTWSKGARFLMVLGAAAGLWASVVLVAAALLG
jgi:hypothetical protein